MAQSGFGFWKILAILMVIVTIGNCAALTSAVDVVSESNRNTSPATSYMPEDYSLIRVGVNNASLGDVIVVYNETYEENVTVNRRGALVVQMNNLTDSRTSVSGWETAKIITFLSKDTDSIQLISVTPPAGTTLQRGTVVPFEVTVDYNLESVATGFVGAELGLSDGRGVDIGDRVDVTQGHGTAVIRGSVDVDHLYDWLHSDTAYLALLLGYKIDPTHSFLLIWKHMPDQPYFIAGAPPQSYAIIVAGEADWRQKSAIDHSANNAYRVLRNLGFDDDHIFYLNDESQQIDGQTVVDKPASLDNLKNSIDEIKHKIGDSPLILYLVGHGIKEVFDFYTASDLLSSAELREMLEPFQDNLMLIVIGSCYSGSFITLDQVTDSISGNNRIIITATHDDEKRRSILGLGGWYHSSDRFWGNLNNGLNVKDAFIMNAWPGDLKNLWLDDNGDNIGHPPDNLGNDGTLASATTMGVAGTDDLELTSWYSVWIHSAGELRVYDSQNRVTGLVNGEVKEEIPDSIYDEQDEIVALFSPSDTYHYEVAGTDEGTYGLDIASIEEGDAITFTATNVTTSTNAAHQYTIDWDALAQGEEGVTIQIDSDGDGTFEQNITTDDTFQPPIASFFPSTPSPVVGEEITFNAAPSYDPDGTITNYGWNFGDGTITDTPEPIITHSYASIGEYTVNLILTDDDGATGTNTTTITVSNPPDLIITEKWLCWPDNCTICYNVTNTGDGTAPAGHNTTLYVDSVVVAHDHVPVDLAPGESYTGCFNGYEWGYTPPSDNITVCADNNKSLVELDEDNNCLANIWICGDVTGDGRVRTSDGRRIFRHLTFGDTIDDLWAADVTGDGRVRTSDGRRIFRHLTFGVPLNCNCSG